MNFFEQELRRLAKACKGIINPTFAGRACYGDLDGDNRVKLEFVTMGTRDNYEALKATVLNRTGGEVDSLLFLFSDTWGHKQVSNRNYSDGIIPYLRTYDHKTDWHVYKVTDADMKQLAAEVGAYLNVFIDRSLIPEKSQGKPSDKASVMGEIRESKQPTTLHTDKGSSARKKNETEL